MKKVSKARKIKKNKTHKKLGKGTISQFLTDTSRMVTPKFLRKPILHDSPTTDINPCDMFLPCDILNMHCYGNIPLTDWKHTSFFTINEKTHWFATSGNHRFHVIYTPVVLNCKARLYRPKIFMKFGYLLKQLTESNTYLILITDELTQKPCKLYFRNNLLQLKCPDGIMTIDSITSFDATNGNIFILCQGEKFVISIQQIEDLQYAGENIIFDDVCRLISLCFIAFVMLSNEPLFNQTTYSTQRAMQTVKNIVGQTCKKSKNIVNNEMSQNPPTSSFCSEFTIYYVQRILYNYLVFTGSENLVPFEELYKIMPLQASSCTPFYVDKDLRLSEHFLTYDLSIHLMSSNSLSVEDIDPLQNRNHPSRHVYVGPAKEILQTFQQPVFFQANEEQNIQPFDILRISFEDFADCSSQIFFIFLNGQWFPEIPQFEANDAFYEICRLKPFEISGKQFNMSHFLSDFKFETSAEIYGEKLSGLYYRSLLNFLQASLSIHFKDTLSITYLANLSASLLQKAPLFQPFEEKICLDEHYWYIFDYSDNLDKSDIFVL